MLHVEALSCIFPGDLRAVDEVSFSVGAGEFFCLLGPSGCGKSTLLNQIGGYLPTTSGTIHLDGKDITQAPPNDRAAAMVFQTYALFPHLSARENVAFGLRVRGVSRAERNRRADEMLDWVRLSQSERNRRPAQLSGGQQQRVALARAMILRPKLLMLDEPFANLDRLLREQLREELRDLQRESGVTAILVTHDREEAFGLADRIAVMKAGRFLQTGPPEQVFHAPANATVAEFLGHQNRYRIASAGKEAVVLENGDSVPASLPSLQPGDWLLIRPDRIRLRTDTDGTACIAERRFTGMHPVIIVELTGGTRLEVSTGESLAPGTRVALEYLPDAFTIVPA